MLWPQAEKNEVIDGNQPVCAQHVRNKKGKVFACLLRYARSMRDDFHRSRSSLTPDHGKDSRIGQGHGRLALMRHLFGQAFSFFLFSSGQLTGSLYLLARVREKKKKENGIGRLLTGHSKCLSSLPLYEMWPVNRFAYRPILRDMRSQKDDLVIKDQSSGSSFLCYKFLRAAFLFFFLEPGSTVCCHEVVCYAQSGLIKKEKREKELMELEVEASGAWNAGTIVPWLCQPLANFQYKFLRFAFFLFLFS